MGTKAVMETNAINNLKEGELIDQTFRLKSSELLHTRSGKPYLNLTFGDQTGEINGKVWDEAETINEHIRECSYVRITGTVGTYRKQLQLKVEQIRVVPEADIDPSLFLPSSEKDPEKMFEELQELCFNNIKNPHLRELLTLYFEDKPLMDEFKASPGAKMLHHSYIGGLLEHTLSVTKICAFLAEHYPGVNKDLLLTAAVLHDLGKIKELTSQPNFDYTTEGRLIGHVVIGYRIFDEKAEKVKEFPPDLHMALGHMLLSHMGETEFKSPVVPMFTEAMILYCADNLDAKTELVSRHINDDNNTGSDFTSYHRLLERFLYKGTE